MENITLSFFRVACHIKFVIKHHVIKTNGLGSAAGHTGFLIQAVDESERPASFPGRFISG